VQDEQDRAEALDDDAHDEAFPPERPLGIEDPTRDDRIEDSLAVRTLREERPEAAEARPVIQPYVDEADAVLDEESELIADATIDERDPEADAMPAPAEEAALHLEAEE
jgi:hypothetical protein